MPRLLSRDDLEVVRREEEAVLAVDARPQPRHEALPLGRPHQPHAGRGQDVERRLGHLLRGNVIEGEVEQGGDVVEHLVGAVLQAGCLGNIGNMRLEILQFLMIQILI